jgi:hypothetical protein
MKLSREKFSKARQFVLDNARPLEVRLFEYHFEDGPAEAVLEALSAYQNPDGGFGHAIEPDFRLPGSSPMATSVGLQHLLAVGTPPDHDRAVAAIYYLVGEFDPVGDFWPHTSMDVNNYPHAPWWEKRDDSPPDEAAWSNPCAELLGYLFYGAEHVPAVLLERARQRGQQNLDSGLAFGKETSFYQMMTWERAVPHLPEPMAKQVRGLLREVYEGMKPLTEEKLAEVHLSALAPSPDALAAQVLGEDVARMMPRELEHQSDDGAWWPGWSWGQYEDVWPDVRVEWAGIITVGMLVTLRSYGLLEV